uniref:Uncharacterized protein n=2 Tax=Oryza sativa subsp. japonica TaxID=39947 RepID=Q6EQ59_ORYSJ|nr:hypothetical protein [Oryza sativa Japonica Group]
MPPDQRGGWNHCRDDGGGRIHRHENGGGRIRYCDDGGGRICHPDDGGDRIHRRDDGGGWIRHRDDVEAGSAAATTGRRDPLAAVMTGEANREGGDGGGRVGADLTASVLGRPSLAVKEVDPAAAGTTTTAAPVMTMTVTVMMMTTATATPTHSPLLPGDHGVDFGRRRPW